MKFNKFVFIKYKLILIFIHLILVYDVVYSIRNGLKDKSNKVYYKNNFYEESDHQVLIEKSEKRKNYIKPNIVIPKSKFKTVAKNIDESDFINFNFKENNGKLFFKDNKDEIDKTVISSIKEIVVDSDGNKNFPDISSYKNANILKDGKEIISVPQYNDETNKSLTNLEKFKQIENVKDSKIDALESKTKSKTSFDDKGTNNIYFADNDIDYLINKKLRESYEIKDFTRINLKEKDKDKDNNNSINTKNVINEKWISQLEDMNRELLSKIKENPIDYSYYIDEFKYDIKELLFKEDIIKIKNDDKKSLVSKNDSKIIEEITISNGKIENENEGINPSKNKILRLDNKDKTKLINDKSVINSNKNYKLQKKDSELINNKDKGNQDTNNQLLIKSEIEDKITKSNNSKNLIPHNFKEIDLGNSKSNLFLNNNKLDKAVEYKVNSNKKINIENEDIDKNSLLANLLNSLE